MAFETDETMAAQAFVAAGVGVTIYPRLGLSPLHPGVVARSLGRDAPRRRIWAAQLREAHVSAASEAMLQILVRTLREEFRAAAASSSPSSGFTSAGAGPADVEALGVVDAHLGEQLQRLG